MSFVDKQHRKEITHELERSTLRLLLTTKLKAILT